METSLNALAASEHVADLHRAANELGPGRAGWAAQLGRREQHATGRGAGCPP